MSPGELGKCLETQTIFALKQAPVPRLVGSTTIGCLENGSRGDCKAVDDWKYGWS
jgi:hypothetical protein